MPFDRTGSEPFHFDPDKLGKVKPTLAEAEGYTLSVEDLKDVFGIDATYFGKLPKRLLVPALSGRWYTEQWYSVTGYLYIVEPEAWVPQVSHGRTLPASTFKTTYVKTVETVEETKFNAGASAQVTISAGGTYYGVTVEAKASSELSFNYSTSTTTKETLETKGVSGDTPIHQLFVYPTLRCKVIKKQRIDYTINDSSKELKWTGESYKPGYWDARWVADKRLDEIRKVQFHPVPMDGNGLGGKAYMLPVPEVTADGELDITTIMSRQGWIDWYVYDIAWQTVADQKITLAAPHNDVAFQPMSTWTTIPPLKSTTATE
ncbi:hypothetical protein QBC46DRAFT_446578 [Diplogelasinospora grovesii]|uniref:Uncharacterized protein n=1 Tax=Diplogelasinospora grovesii TaxID=303347 RepID=A0AAN6NDK5_9PEZI|nr:hypothetical protein QBC46DRAFT_446578 [Diplogelasinospora grovesii]